MSMGPVSGVIASVAGTPLAQTKGSEVERTQQEVNAQQRRTTGERKAESAAGISETDGQEHQAAERDADGRRLWEEQAGSPPPPPTDDAAQDTSHMSKDLTGQSGTQLDLCG